MATATARRLQLVREGSAGEMLEHKGKSVASPVRTVRIGPELAIKLLEADKLIRNRKLVQSHVDALARDMKNDRWQPNGDAIRFSRDGDLMDGQHRLWAVVESGVPIDFLVVDGLDPEVMATIDTGRKRTFGDVLTIGGTKNAVVTAGALRWMYWWTKQRKFAFSSIKPTHSELQAVLEKNQDIAEAASEIYGQAPKTLRLVTPSVLVFCYTLFKRADAQRAGQWISLLQTGANMDEKHPVHQLRERVIANRNAKAKLSSVDIAALTVKSWNQFKTGKRTKSLVWKSTEPFPDVEGLK